MEKQLQEIISRTLPNPTKFRARNNYFTCYILDDLHLAITLIDGRFQFSITKSYPDLRAYQFYASTCFDLDQLEDEFKAMKTRLVTRGLIAA